MKKNSTWVRPVLQYLSQQDTSKSYYEIINEATLLSPVNKTKVLRQSKVCPTPRSFEQAIRKERFIQVIKTNRKATTYKYITQ
jgi:hypothetical protein